MGKEIRLFLCIRSPLSGERVIVLRSVDDAKASWLEERANCLEASALLHAGADRPSFEAFRLILEAHRGHVLLSEAARWLLDEEHAEHRIAALSLTAIPRQRSQPLYLAVAGWGYDLPLQGRDQSASVNRTKEISPDSYDRLLKTIDPDDPFEVARICPSGLVRSALSEIPMTVRCENVLVNMEISTIEQMQSLYLKDALRWSNFGKKSAVDLAKALHRFIDCRVRSGGFSEVVSDSGDEGHEPEVTEWERPDHRDHRTLAEELVDFSSTLKTSQQRVLDERILKQKSLEQVGELLGVTRERVRQIESRLLDSMAKLAWASSLKERISKLLAGRMDPLFLDLVEVEDPWFAGWSMRASELAALISVFPSDVTVLRTQSRLIVSRITADCFDRVLRSTLDFLAKQVHEGWTRGDVELFVEGAVRSEKAPELAGLALDLLLPELHFSGNGVRDKEVLCSVGGHLNELIMAVLRSAEAPLHFTDIAAAVSERVGRKLSDHNVHARLPRTPALFFGRGRYGAEAHYPISVDVEVELAGLLEDIMLADSERQWHTAELIDALEAKGEDLPEVLDKYVLNILLSRSQQFRDMGRMVWSLKAVRETETRGRIDLSDACVQVLVQSGRPLHSREIKECIGRLRGTSEFFFIQPTAKIARVAPNEWGLVDRDFYLGAEGRTQFLADLESELERRAVSLHVSELSDVFGGSYGSSRGITNYMLMGLAQTDARFRVHRGHLIALSRWNDPRRPTVRSAVGMCVSGRAEVTVPELLLEVAGVVAREVQRGEVTNMLLQMGWRRRGFTETYESFVGDDDESIEETLGAETISLA